MKTLLYIFLGGGAGSAVRFLVQTFVNRNIPGSDFPIATFIINLAGSLLIGLSFSLSAKFNLSYEVRLLLIVGFCGGFTTFSTFSNENLTLLRSGLYGTFILYTLCSVFLGIACALLGVWLGKNIL